MMNKKLIIGTVTGLLLTITPAWGFKVNYLGTTPSKPIHEDITRDALKDITVYFPDGTEGKLNPVGVMNRISALASFNDEYGIEDGSLHFDDSRLEESAARIKRFISAATLHYDDNSPTIEGFGHLIDYKFALDIAQAMHTTQDFFAHSTWVETNVDLKAFDTDNKLEPLLKKLPYPKLGIVENPFGAEFSSPSDVKVLDDNPSNTNNDEVTGGCKKSEPNGPHYKYDPKVMQLTSAYYDYAMSPIPAYHKEVDKGYSTSNWNGTNSSIMASIPTSAFTTIDLPFYGVGPVINWPKERCVHGGDEGSGINQDHEGRQYHKQARQSAIEASRNLMLEFLRVSGATTGLGKERACKVLFQCTESTKPSISNIKLSHITSNTDRRNVWSFSISGNLDAHMLGASFNGLECEVFQFTNSPAFMCPNTDKGTYKGEGVLKIYQKANPTFALHQLNNFIVNPEMVIDHYPLSGLTGVIGICTPCEGLVSHGVITAYDINWGDGKLENFVMGIQDALHKHAYTSEGTKTVVITFKDKFGNTFQEARTINISKSVMAIQGGTTQQAGQAAVFSMQKVFADATSVFWRFFDSVGEAFGAFLKDVSDKISQVFDIGDYKAVAEIRSGQGLLETVEQSFNVKGLFNIDKDAETSFNDPTLESLYEVQKVGLDTTDGTLRLPLKVGDVDSTFPYIWIANSGEGTISKLDVNTGVELGRYRTGPGNGNPSRTTVDQDGNVWVGNRNNNTITKVGLKEFDNCVDRNGNGVIDTSTGKDDVKDWGGYFGDGQGIANAQDECVLQHVALQADGVSTPYDIRMIAIDKDNNVFTGGHQTSSIFKVDGKTGKIINAAMTNGSFYGGLIDKEGNVWAASRYFHGGVGRVLKVSNDLSTSEVIDAGIPVYGIALDKYGKIWVTDAYSTAFATFNPTDFLGTQQIFYQQNRGWQSCYAQGLAVDDNDNVFIAGSACQNDAIVGHYKQVINGNVTSVEFVANYHVSSGPTGVAVDGKGNVWSSDQTNNAVSRITLATNPVDAKIETFKVGYQPYNYSDMTGRTVRNITNRQGTWEAIFDGAIPDFEWKKLVWTLKQALPEGTNVTAYAKAANAKVELGGKQYAEVKNNQTIAAMKGRFIKVKFQLTSSNQTATPEIKGIDLQ